MQEEIWKRIKDHKDYMVSNLGRIKSFKIVKEGKVLKLEKTKIGYLRIGLFENKKIIRFLVHRLVAQTFVENNNPKEYIQINHIDEDKQNNCVENLEWCSPQYNTEYSQAKKYKILYPDKHEEIIFNLCKFCRDNNLDKGSMNNSLRHGWFHKGYKLLEVINDNGTISKANKPKKKIYKILYSDNHEETTNNLTVVCKENNLNIDCMLRTLRVDCKHKGFKILEKT